MRFSSASRPRPFIVRPPRRLRGLGDGAPPQQGVGNGWISNYWASRANFTAPYVMTVDPVYGSTLRPALSGYPRPRRMGDPVAYGPPDASGNISVGGPSYPNDQITAEIMSGAAPLPANVDPAWLAQVAAGGNIVQGPGGFYIAQNSNPPPPPPPGMWQQFTNWLGSPLTPGSSIKIGYLFAGAAGLALLAGFAGRGRR